MSDQMDGSPQTAPALDTSASDGLSTTNDAAPPSDPQARINNLMSKWQKEEAERVRLEQVLARETTERLRLKEQLETLQKSAEVSTVELSKKFEQAEKELQELKAKAAEAEVESARLRFIASNPDLAAYADILPKTADTAALQKTAETIRGARAADTEAMRSHLVSGPGRTGQAPRVDPPQMTSKQIEAYLAEVRGKPEFEKRLREVTGRL